MVLGFETLDLKFRKPKLWELTVPSAREIEPWLQGPRSRAPISGSGLFRSGQAAIRGFETLPMGIWLQVHQLYFQTNSKNLRSSRGLMPHRRQQAVEEFLRRRKTQLGGCGRFSYQLYQDCTPEINTSEIIVIFSGIFPWIVGGIFQQKFTSQWYYPKGCHLSSGSLLELSNGLSAVLSDIITLLWVLACNLSRRIFRRPPLPLVRRPARRCTSCG